MRFLEAGIKAGIVSMAITAIWYGLEFIQFKELQWNRECDNVVFWLYLIVLWFAFYKKIERL